MCKYSHDLERTAAIDAQAERYQLEQEAKDVAMAELYEAVEQCRLEREMAEVEAEMAGWRP